LIAVAFATPGSVTTIPVGWCGLLLWLAALLVATIAWAVVERPSSRDLTAIQPLFREVAKAYLTGDLAAAEQGARRLVALASAEAGAWRLLALVTRAQGRTAQATKLDRRAARLDLPHS
jgi:Flp pilus assembly protein TadD